MESQEVIETTMACHNSDGVDDLNVCTSSGNGFDSKQDGVGVENSGRVDVDLLEDLDIMMEDIDHRLRVSRMVSDSVIRGMVSAVEQEADEKIKAKELELASLKRSLQCLNLNGDQNESWWLQGTHGPNTVEFKGYANFEDACIKHDKMKESSLVLRKSATDQFKRLRKQIEGARGCKIKRNGSCHEMVGLGGILKEKEYENCVGLEKTVDNLEMTINNISRLVDTVLIFSKTSLSDWQQEHDLKGELEDMVIQSSIRSIRKEFQEELWGQNASCCGSQSIVLAKKFSNISGLRHELEALIKLLPSCESGHLVSHGSFDMDNTHGNPLRSQLSLRWGENGMSDESKPSVPDSFNAAELSHLKGEDLVNFFNNMISKIKREHESKVQQMTESYISLKGKYLSERRSLSLPNKEFEILRRKIPEVVSKLDGILSESGEFIGRGDSVASINVLNNSLNTLIRENRQLRDSLAAKEKEVTHLSTQLSVASEKMLQHASSAANFQKLVKNHETYVADTCIEASIVEDVYKSVIGKLCCQIQDMKEESELGIIAMQDIYEVLLGVASDGQKDTSDCAIEDTYMESFFMQELLDTVFKEALADVEQKFENLHKEYITTNENLVSLKKKAIEREVELKLGGEERERLRSEVHSLRSLVEEKETLARELTKEREQFELALGELNNLRKQASWQETLMSKTNKKLDEMGGKLSKAEEKLVSDRMEINSLNQKLELAMEEIRALVDYKNMFLALSEEKQSLLSLTEAKEKEHRKQMEAVVVLVDELSTKLENSRSQLSSLIKPANVLKSTGLLYKQKLESKCSDLQMAEDEVDLLGDEVETLLGLLEKIYIALDHYSPVLQHYPGVIEILKLVRRELSGESLKAQ
ncbi:hypothetical protein Ccrd_013869 [Cynara cardunculus var. scolymus]|uniref:WPP domain-associated protein n=1 Tax=Cynara cardunculus var. scolymus TaxID=59895 RepID=A0A103YET3_CYNCS|nr:hypothetical protein Ccrd_013869 [Cynara cardunculus var. scolymus]